MYKRQLLSAPCRHLGAWHGRADGPSVNSEVTGVGLAAVWPPADRGEDGAERKSGKRNAGS